MSNSNKSSSSNKIKLTDDNIKAIIDNYETLSANAIGHIKNIIDSIQYYNMWCDYVLSDNGKIPYNIDFMKIDKFRQNIAYTPIPSNSKLVKLFNEFMIAEKAEIDAEELSIKAGHIYNEIGKLDSRNKYDMVYDNPILINQIKEPEIKRLFKEYHKYKGPYQKKYKRRLELQNEFEKAVLEIFRDENKQHELPVFSKKPQIHSQLQPQDGGNKKKVNKRK